MIICYRNSTNDADKYGYYVRYFTCGDGDEITDFAHNMTIFFNEAVWFVPGTMDYMLN